MLFEYIAFFILLFTSLIGIFSIVKVITEWIFDDSEIMKKIIILPLYKSDDRFEMMLKTFLVNNKGVIYLVDMGLDEETTAIVEDMIKNYSEVKLINASELSDSIGAIVL